MFKPLCIFLSALMLSYSQHCPDGWSQFGSKCLIVKSEKKAWFGAEEYCNQAARNGHLTSISSAFENTQINGNSIYKDRTTSISLVVFGAARISNRQNEITCNMTGFFFSENCPHKEIRYNFFSETLTLAQASGISTSQFWIGGTDFEQSGNFSWFDGQPFLYTNWEQGQPDLTKHCVSSKATTTGKWKAEVCGVANCFICEAPQFFPSCPADWIYFPVTQSCYRVFLGTSSWDDANNKCHGSGGNLTSIHSDTENKFVGALASDYVDTSSFGNQTFIGMRDLMHNRQWGWSDGSAVNYFNWAPGEPNNVTGGTENCVELYSDVTASELYFQYQWNDTPCDEAMRSFVCKRSPTWSG